MGLGVDVGLRLSCGVALDGSLFLKVWDGHWTAEVGSMSLLLCCAGSWASGVLPSIAVPSRAPALSRY